LAHVKHNILHSSLSLGPVKEDLQPWALCLLWKLAVAVIAVL